MARARTIPIAAAAPVWKGNADCRQCGVRDIVLFADLNDEDLELIHEPISDLEYSRGTTLYHEGSAADSLFTVRRGAVKLVRNNPDGSMRIVRVLRTGDVAGLEALAVKRYDSQAVALMESEVCRIPVTVIQRLNEHSPRLHIRLMEKWHDALREADDWLAELNHGPARRRVAHFILKMRKPDEPDLVTLFSREDMGAMMDLKFETVSREISALTRAGHILPMDNGGRLYRLADLAAMELEANVA